MSAAAEPTFALQAQRAAEWHGWKPAPDLSRCPRVLAGKRCRAGTSHLDRNLCPCLIWHSTMLDHAMRWKTGDGSDLLTGEPYGAPATAERFARAMSDLGLEVEAKGTARSPWAPGSTHLYVIRRAP